MARPQQITDEAILAVIDELRKPHRKPSGVTVRNALWSRFRVRASTDRVYRLLNEPPASPAFSPAQRPDEFEQRIEELTAERDAALGRAELAELREQSTQSRLSMQIDHLRQRLVALGVNPYSLKF